jgi:uncharacterized protein
MKRTMKYTYTWDDVKSAKNFKERGLAFEVGAMVFDGQHDLFLDTRRHYGEPRFVAQGLVDGRSLVVVYTEKDDTRRIISVRLASRRERRGVWGKLFVKV